jgi:hypothetical protein
MNLIGESAGNDALAQASNSKARGILDAVKHRILNIISKLISSVAGAGRNIGASFAAAEASVWENYQGQWSDIAEIVRRERLAKFEVTDSGKSLTRRWQ